MFVKYKDNIHNIENYQSIVKVGEKEILLVSSHSASLIFDDVTYRDWVIFHIWTQLKSGEHFLDLDADLEVFITAKKYKL